MTNTELIDMTIKEIDTHIEDQLKDFSDIAVKKFSQVPHSLVLNFISNTVLLMIKGISKEEFNNIPADDEVSPSEFLVILCLTILKLLKDNSTIKKIIEEFLKMRETNPFLPTTSEEEATKIYFSMLRTILLLMKNEFLLEHAEIGDIIEKYTQYKNNEYIYLSKLKGSIYYLNLLAGAEVMTQPIKLFPESDSEDKIIN